MKTVLGMILSVLLMGTQSLASYKGEFQGSTQTEREIRWAWRYLNDFLFSCRHSVTDCQSPEIKASIDQLLAYTPAMGMVQMPSWENLLNFVSEKDHPEYFQSADSETHRVASTQLQKFATIYINTDRMNLPLESWVGILAHEALHHLGVADGQDRYPDQLAAEIAKHFKRQVQASSLEQFNLPTARTLVFNPASEGRGSVSFISSPVGTADMGWESNPQHPVCANYEKIAQQFVSAPAWRVNRFQSAKGIVTVRGGGYVTTVCLNKATNTKRTTTFPIDAALALQYPAPLDLAQWVKQVPTVLKSQEDAFSPSGSANDVMFGQAQTFFIQSIQHEQSVVEAGSSWKTKILLKSIDGFQPDSCTLFLAGTQYSYIGQDHLPGINYFDTCELINLGSGHWQVNGTTVMPASARPDQYYIPAIFFNKSPRGDMRSAIPALPTFIQLTNKNAMSVPSIPKIDILGLESASKLGTLSLTNSYKLSEGQHFDVEFTVQGDRKADDVWLDMNIWFVLPTEFGVGRITGSTDSYQGILMTKTVVTPVSQGTKVTMSFVMPGRIQQFEIAALKFSKIYLRTSDYSWAEIELPDLHDHLVINRNFGQ